MLQDRIRSMLYERTVISKLPDETTKNGLNELSENETRSKNFVFRNGSFSTPPYPTQKNLPLSVIVLGCLRDLVFPSWQIRRDLSCFLLVLSVGAAAIDRA